MTTTKDKLVWDDQHGARDQWVQFEADLMVAMFDKNADMLWDLAACDAFVGQPVAGALVVNWALPIPQGQELMLKMRHEQNIRDDKLYRQRVREMQKLLESSFSLISGAFSPECAAFRDLKEWLVAPMPALNVPLNGWRADHRWRWIWEQFKLRYSPAQEINVRHIREQLEMHTDASISFSAWSGKFATLTQRLAAAQGHPEDDIVLRGLIGRNCTNPHLTQVKDCLFFDFGACTIAQFMANARKLIANQPHYDSGGGSPAVFGGAATTVPTKGKKFCIRCGRDTHNLYTRGQACSESSCIRCHKPIDGYHECKMMAPGGGKGKGKGKDWKKKNGKKKVVVPTAGVPGNGQSNAVLSKAQSKALRASVIAAVRNMQMGASAGDAAGSGA